MINSLQDLITEIKYDEHISLYYTFDKNIIYYKLMLTYYDITNVLEFTQLEISKELFLHLLPIFKTKLPTTLDDIITYSDVPLENLYVDEFLSIVRKHKIDSILS